MIIKSKQDAMTLVLFLLAKGHELDPAYQSLVGAAGQPEMLHLIPGDWGQPDGPKLLKVNDGKEESYRDFVATVKEKGDAALVKSNITKLNELTTYLFTTKKGDKKVSLESNCDLGVEIVVVDDTPTTPPTVTPPTMTVTPPQVGTPTPPTPVVVSADDKALERLVQIEEQLAKLEKGIQTLKELEMDTTAQEAIVATLKAEQAAIEAASTPAQGPTSTDAEEDAIKAENRKLVLEYATLTKVNKMSFEDILSGKHTDPRVTELSDLLIEVVASQLEVKEN